ncbi:SDR family NAD(P)-dependent oxidoreductase [Pseudomonas oryzihabitans]|uniref:SDR family NAD(P)-dependent oxidoreductase n=1 Tax=Pseudomonas oryzihabitans TaxID=47885 RepID=UPI000736FD11|nr:SDR family oxidoreductase [Pseudomonas psychrotolerans]KTT49999.1 short-chain dehydrogenase [Pseudomonas psychrotolerans]
MQRYALVTGASCGIGLALAEALARRGQPLILLARRKDKLESIAAELAQRFDVEVLYRVCDLAEPLHLTGLLHELEQSERAIGLLVNCAGIGSGGDFLAADWPRVQEQLELNILALTRLCHALGQHMAIQGGGQILNVASTAAFQPIPYMSSYAATKAYVLHFSEGLREELKKRGVSVSVLCPGPTRTAFFKNAGLHTGRMEQGKLLMSAEEVALAAMRGLERRQAVIVPGWRNRLGSLLPRFFPRALVRSAAVRIGKLFQPA